MLQLKYISIYICYYVAVFILSIFSLYLIYNLLIKIVYLYQ
jgi:hypothetical protein